MARVTKQPVDSFRDQFRRAVARGRRTQEANPQAVHVAYDANVDRIVVELSNGLQLAFPRKMAQGLSGATAKQLNDISISPSGLGLRWEELDVDLSLPDITRGAFGTKAWMRELGRAGGLKTSAAKAAAARANGRRGGRPRTRLEA